MQCVGETGNAVHTRMKSHHKMLNKQVAPHFSNEGLEVMDIEKHTRTITCHAESNRKATGPLNKEHWCHMD